MPNFALSLFIAFLGLDTTIAFQVMISQPIFSCPILGWLLGDPLTGMEIGAMMQLLWLNNIPAGGNKFPEGNIASMVMCILVIRYMDLALPNLVFTAAFLISFVTSYVGSVFTVLDRRLNGYILQWAQSAAHTASLRRLTLLDLMSIASYWLIMALMTYLTLLYADWAMPYIVDLPNQWEAALGLVKPVLWGIGIGLTALIIFGKQGKQK